MELSELQAIEETCILNALHELHILEQNRVLSKEEGEFYVYCYNLLSQRGVEIPFGVEI